MLFKTVDAFAKLEMLLIGNFAMNQTFSLLPSSGHLRISTLWKEIM